MYKLSEQGTKFNTVQLTETGTYVGCGLFVTHWLLLLQLICKYQIATKHNHNVVMISALWQVNYLSININACLHCPTRQ